MHERLGQSLVKLHYKTVVEGGGGGGRSTSFTGFSPSHPNGVRERKRVGEKPGKEVGGG